jgi:hypothetical protein
LLPDGDAKVDIDRLNTAVGTLRRDGMPKSFIIDRLVGASCPMVASDSALTTAEKTARLQRFTGQITQLVYSFESGLDIIINVPLTPDVVATLNAAARNKAFQAPPGSP